MTNYTAHFRTLKDAEKYATDMRRVRGEGQISDPIRHFRGGYVVVVIYAVNPER